MAVSHILRQHLLTSKGKNLFRGKIACIYNVVIHYPVLRTIHSSQSITCNFGETVEYTNENLEGQEEQALQRDTRRDANYIQSVLSSRNVFLCPAKHIKKLPPLESSLVELKTKIQKSTSSSDIVSCYEDILRTSDKLKETQLFFEARSAFVFKILARAHKINSTSLPEVHRRPELYIKTVMAFLESISGVPTITSDFSVSDLVPLVDILYEIVQKMPKKTMMEEWFSIIHYMLLWKSAIGIRNCTPTIGKYEELLTDKFYSRCINVLKTPDEVLIFCSIAGQLKKKIPTPLLHNLMHILQSNTYSIRTDIGLAATVCWAFFRCEQRIQSRLVLLTTLDKLMLEVKSNNYYFTTPSHILVKELAYSMDRVMFKQHPYVFAKYNDALKKLMPRIKNEDMAIMVRLMHGVLCSRYVPLPSLRLFAGKLNNTTLSKLRLKELAMAVESLAEVDAVRVPELYDKIVDELKSPGRMEELEKFPRSTVSALIGLSYLNIHPESIYDLLLSKPMIMKFSQKWLVSKNSLAKLLWLDGCIGLANTNYDGSRLDNAFKQHVMKVCAIEDRRADGTFTHQAEMTNQILDIVNNSKVIAPLCEGNIGRILDHSLLQDIIIRGKKDHTKAVIVPCSEMLYVRLIKPGEDGTSETTLRLMSQHRIRMKQMQNKGFKVLPISFHEYQKSKNPSRLIQDKLQSIGIL